MSRPTFKLYRKPDLPKTAQDKRKPEPAVYIGHMVVTTHCQQCHKATTSTYGIEARAVEPDTKQGEPGGRHFEGNVIDWQDLVRRHVAMPKPPKTNTGQSDLVEQIESAPFDDPLPTNMGD